jgi:hypothetical protein
MTLRLILFSLWAFFALKYPFAFIISELGPNFYILGILISSFISVCVTYVIIHVKTGEDMGFDKLMTLFTFYIIFQLTAPLIFTFLFLSLFYSPWAAEILMNPIWIFEKWGLITVMHAQDNAPTCLTDVTRPVYERLDAILQAPYKGSNYSKNMFDLLSPAEQKAFMDKEMPRGVDGKPLFALLRNIPKDQIAPYANKVSDDSLMILIEGKRRNGMYVDCNVTDPKLRKVCAYLKNSPVKPPFKRLPFYLN